jgi:hypothetical protein
LASKKAATGTMERVRHYIPHHDGMTYGATAWRRPGIRMTWLPISV